MKCQIIKELSLCVIIVILITLGFVVQGCDLCFIPQINESTAGIIVQINATIMTLTIALVSLLGNVIHDQYLGIGYASFYLNFKPRIFKQKVVLGLSLIDLVASAASLWLCWHYVIFSLFISEMILVWITGSNVFCVFNDSDKIKAEVRFYSLHRQIPDKYRKSKKVLEGEK